MGTYSAVLTLFSTSGDLAETNNEGYDGKLKEFIRLDILTGNGALNGISVYIFTGNCFSLDGNPAIAFTGLPAGLLFQDVTFNVNESGSFTTAAGILLAANPSFDTSTSDASWGIHGPIHTVGGNNVNIISPNTSGISLKVIDFLSSLQYSLAISSSNVASTAGSEAFTYKNLKAVGNYTIYASITPSSSTVTKKMKITLTSADKLDLLQEVKTYDNNGNFLGDATISNQSSTSITLTIPDTGYLGAATLVGVEFSGRTYILQPLTIILSNPAGIYQIVPGKINDTLYLDHTTVTQDVAIPSPFIKTGFIDGE